MKKLKLPGIGLRTIKTAVAVMICLGVFYFIGRNPIYACIAAIISMQSTVENSINTGRDRLIGTAVGGLWGILFTMTLHYVDNNYLYILMIGLGIILVIYCTILLKKPGAVSISCVVFLIIMINAQLAVDQTMADSLDYSVKRVVDTALGVVIGVIVNILIKNPNIKTEIPEKIETINAEDINENKNTKK